jgi:cytochrome P450
MTSGTANTKPTGRNETAFMTETVDLAALLSGPDFETDPYPAYAELRGNSGWTAPSGYRVFSSYEDVQQILKQPDLFGQETVPYPNFHTTDPPVHTRIRRLVAKAFTAHSVGLLRGQIDEIVARKFDDLADREEFDLVQEFAQLVSAAVIASVLTVPESDAVKWYPWMWDLARFRGITRYFPFETIGDPGALEAAKHANDLSTGYMRHLIETHESLRDGSIVDGLFEARENDDSLSEPEILGTLVLLLGAGLHTTSGQMSNTFRLILSRPEIAAQLRADPELVPNAVEEALRIEGALQAEYRVVRSELTLSGVELAAGDHLIVVNGAANHDPAVFENPEVFDIRRENARRHLTFGFGIHHCLGAELARTELVSATRQLLARFPTVELLDRGKQSRWDRWRSLSALPVRVAR